MIGALLSAIILLVALLTNFALPWWRRRKLKSPTDVFFHIRTMTDGELGYAMLDDRGHLVRELVLPANRTVHVEISHYPKVHFRQEEFVFGCEGDVTSKPLPIERYTPYVERGKNLWRPEDDETDYVGRTGFYHVRRPAPRNIGTCYTVGFNLKTQGVGTYKAIVSFLNDEVEGNALLTIRVQEKPSGRLRCYAKGHKGCYVRPVFTRQ